MRLLFLVVVLCSACAHLKDDQTVCAEYREMRCLAGTTCDYDKLRGCKVCQCRALSAEINGYRQEADSSVFDR